MTISERGTADDLEIKIQERIVELEKANQALHTEIQECKSSENDLIKLKDKIGAEIALRHNRILEGINRVFSIVVQDKTGEDLGNECLAVALEVIDSQIGFVNLVGDDGLLHDVAISDMGWEQCSMHDKTGHRRLPGNFVLQACTAVSLTAKEASLLTIPYHTQTVSECHMAIQCSLRFLAYP